MNVIPLRRKKSAEQGVEPLQPNHLRVSEETLKALDQANAALAQIEGCAVANQMQSTLQDLRHALSTARHMQAEGLRIAILQAMYPDRNGMFTS